MAAFSWAESGFHGSSLQGFMQGMVNFGREFSPGTARCASISFTRSRRQPGGRCTQKYAMSVLKERARADCLAELLDSQEIGGQRLTIRALRRTVAALGVQKIDQACRSALVRILGDIPVLLRL